MSEPEDVVYKFRVKGRYPNGNTVKFEGIVRAPDGFPQCAFDLALKTCQDTTPGLIVDTDNGGNIVLSKRKKKKREPTGQI
jgi:hypothetical protein